MEYAPAVLAGLQGARVAAELGSKYLPTIKKTFLHHIPTARRSAMRYIRDLKSRGVEGAASKISKDIPKVAQKSYKLIKSGKVLKAVKDVGSDVEKGLSAYEGVAGKSKASQAVRDFSNQAQSQIKGHHEALENIMDTARHRIYSSNST